MAALHGRSTGQVRVTRFNSSPELFPELPDEKEDVSRGYRKLLLRLKGSAKFQRALKIGNNTKERRSASRSPHRKQRSDRPWHTSQQNSRGKGKKGSPGDKSKSRRSARRSRKPRNANPTPFELRRVVEFASGMAGVNDTGLDDGAKDGQLKFSSEDQMRRLRAFDRQYQASRAGGLTVSDPPPYFHVLTSCSERNRAPSYYRGRYRAIVLQHHRSNQLSRSSSPVPGPSAANTAGGGDSLAAGTKTMGSIHKKMRRPDLAASLDSVYHKVVTMPMLSRKKAATAQQKGGEKMKSRRSISGSRRAASGRANSGRAPSGRRKNSGVLS